MSDTPPPLEAGLAAGAETTPAAAPIRRGEPDYLRILAALAAAGLSIFGLLYCPQPLLPLLAARFGQSPAGASLAISASTGALAVGLLASSGLSARLGKARLMTLALFAAAGLTLLAAVAPNWPLFLLLRGATGLVLAGAPAAAMAYVAEEVEPSAVGPAMGFYVASTALGGMAGRLGVGLAADALGWRGALAVAGATGAVAAAVFTASLPRRARPVPGAAGRPAGRRPALGFVRDPVLRGLYAAAFLLMGVFVAVYNYLGFRLTEPPYRLGQAAVASVFAVYLVGMAGSALAGEATARFGAGRVLPAAVLLTLAGALLTAVRPLALVLAGLALVTFGFFAAHATASGWVGRRAGELPGAPRAAAASAYLVSYYAGSSLLGALGGVAWARGGWAGLEGLSLLALGLALAGALWLARRAAPLQPAGHVSAPERG